MIDVKTVQSLAYIDSIGVTVMKSMEGKWEDIRLLGTCRRITNIVEHA